MSVLFSAINPTHFFIVIGVIDCDDSTRNIAVSISVIVVKVK